ncbi:PIG-L family deacetylase [Embleya scabrispora]|uniref:PIG-L family deacetylase n=1 Tax=Embleya scabrispora TaxID=159449 RepID=UPI0003A6D3AE|nr:PIG-L family deacetylase [Embleya scabrispora]MYS79946.1 hypothetical protein [Streptomyces sp. SID5474]
MPMPSPTRRGLLVTAGGVLAAAVAPLTWWGLDRRDEPRRNRRAQDIATKTPAPAKVPASVMHVIAHADDDLYFMNPDVLATLGPDARSVTVVLTAGESDGRNFGRDDPRRTKGAPDRAGFTGARQNGARGAYALMALGDRTARWKRERLDTRGAVAELNTLIDAPGVQLVFLSMHEAGMITAFSRNSLRALWENTLPRLGTLPAKGGLVTTASSFTRDSLLETLTDLMGHFRPTLLRTLDPDPETSPQGPDHVPTPDDHQDHTAAALFALEALRRYQEGGAPGRPPTVVESYRAYCNAHWPHNLGSEGFGRKKKVLETYGWVDAWDCGDPIGCGDRKVGSNVAVYNWAESTYPRYPGTANWTQAGPNGALYSFAVLDGQAVVWATGADGSWQKAATLGGGLLAPRLEVLKRGDGRLQLFSLRMNLAADPAAQRREIVTCVQNAGGSFGSWTSLGAPDEADPVAVRETGSPTVIADGAGRLHLFARNKVRSLSERVQNTDGTWQPWRSLGGTEIQDGVSAVALKDGRIEVYASTRTGIARWSQSRGGDPLTLDSSMPYPAPGGPLTAYAEADGRVALLTRQVDSGRILLYRQSAPGASWAKTDPIDLGGQGGTGAPAALRVQGVEGVLLAHRNDGLGVSVARLPSTPTGAPTWTDLGGKSVHLPAVTADAAGRVLITVLGPDGRMSSARQERAGAAAAFGAWTQAPIG